LPDGTFINKLLIEEGYAHEYTYKVPYQYQEQFRAAERNARENKRGLWAPEACPTPSL
jgi:micrococcal nuclease